MPGSSCLGAAAIPPVPARMTVRNLDKTAGEFESKSLMIDKIVPGCGQAVIRIRPLAKGRSDRFGDNNEKTAHGVQVVE